MAPPPPSRPCVRLRHDLVDRLYGLATCGLDAPFPEANWGTALPSQTPSSAPAPCAVAHSVWPVRLQKQLSRAVRTFERRIEWLSLASRRIWGTVCEKRYPPTRSVLVLVGSLCDTALIQLIGALSGAPEATTEVKDQQSPGRTRKKSPRQRRPE